MIPVAGFNVYPTEMESVVVSRDGVLEAAAIGRPDAKAGEAVKLFVVRRDQELTAGRIIERIGPMLSVTPVIDKRRDKSAKPVPVSY